MIMRLDMFLSKVGVVKRRSIAKELADNGIIKLNGNTAKAGKEIKIGDIIQISGKRPAVIEIVDIPTGSVKQPSRSTALDWT